MGPPESVQTISSQHAHDIGEISNFIWLPITAVREFCVPTRALCAHIFKFPGKVSAWLAWCGHTELSAWLAWSDSKFANIFSVCWLNTKNIFCTPWGGQILPILQFSLWHEHSRYVIWTESGFEAWWDPRAFIWGMEAWSPPRGCTDMAWLCDPLDQPSYCYGYFSRGMPLPWHIYRRHEMSAKCKSFQGLRNSHCKW